MVRLAFK